MRQSPEADEKPEKRDNSPKRRRRREVASVCQLFEEMKKYLVADTFIENKSILYSEATAMAPSASVVWLSNLRDIIRHLFIISRIVHSCSKWREAGKSCAVEKYLYRLKHYCGSYRLSPWEKNLPQWLSVYVILTYPVDLIFRDIV